MIQVRWYLGGVAALALAAMFVALGLWQLDRHSQRDEINQAVLASQRAEPVPLRQVCPHGECADDAEYRRVTAVGRFDEDEQILVRHRIAEKRTGLYVLTPLVTANGTLLVVRGWIPPAAGGASAEPVVPAPPSGDVAVTGRIRVPEEGKSVSSQLGRYRAVTRIQPSTLAGSAPASYPVYIELISADPEPEEPLVRVDAPVVDSGPHLSYAVQWFAFAILALTTYVVLLVRHRRSSSKADR